MKSVLKDNVHYWYDETLLKEPIHQSFDVDFWKQNDRIIGSAQGRGTTWFVKTQTMNAALRHYRRGGLFGKLVKDQYWFSGWEKTRSYQELTLLQNLIRAGVSVPRPIAACAVKKGCYYTADLLSEKIADAQDLVAILQEKSLSTSMFQKIGKEIRKMHEAGVNHTDLNIHNILIDEQSKVWIIDFDKCYQQKGSDWKQGNLERLKRSFEKESVRFSIHFNSENFAQLVAGYQSLD